MTQIPRLLGRFYPFSHQLNAKPLSERNDDVRHRGVHGISADSAGKGLINFQHVRMQLFQPRE